MAFAPSEPRLRAAGWCEDICSAPAHQEGGSHGAMRSKENLVLSSSTEVIILWRFHIMNQIFESLTWTVWSFTRLAKISSVNFPFGFHLNCFPFLSLEGCIGLLFVLQILASIGFSNKMSLKPMCKKRRQGWGLQQKAEEHQWKQMAGSKLFSAFPTPPSTFGRRGPPIHSTPSLEWVPALCFHWRKTNYSWLFISLRRGWKAYQALSVLNSEQNILDSCTVRFSFIHIIAICFVQIKVVYDFCHLTLLPLGYAILKMYFFHNSTKKQLSKKEKENSYFCLSMKRKRRNLTVLNILTSEKSEIYQGHSCLEV